MISARVHLLPPGADLLDQAAQQIIVRNQDRLPDLGGVTVLLPFHSAAPRLRRALAWHTGRGLLGPRLQTLGVFAQARAPQAGALPALDCRLRLASALARHRRLFPGVSNTRAADALYALFEEFIAHGISLDDEKALTQRLQDAYRAPAGLPFLGFEAQIAHRLFAAYLQETDGRSPAAIYRAQLAAAFGGLQTDESLYLLGFDEFAPAEMRAVKAALDAGRAELWLQGRCEGRDGVASTELLQQLGLDPPTGEPSTSPQDRLLDAAFSTESHLTPPALTAAPAYELALASGPEHEARCVDLAIREALLGSAKTIVVISQDRRLARRLRALLERAGVGLHDPAGWALSTSSAAANIAAWLECLAGDFNFRPLLALLKSDFASTPPAALRALDRDLIHGIGIESGLSAYRRAAQGQPDVLALLDRLETAARHMPDWRDPKPGAVWCQALKDSLDALQLWPRLRQDAAGEALVRLIEELGGALQQHPLLLDGDGFREVLDRLLEHETFVPLQARAPVQLLTLEQSQNLRCDLLILAGVNREQLPGSPPAEPLFNAHVRAELGLPSWRSRHTRSLARLRRVLQSAPRVLMTHAPESPGEDAVLSPWIEALEATAAAAGHTLRRSRLPALAVQRETEIASDDRPLPPATLPPAAPAVAALIPGEISATAHQSLLDCPYRFFASQLLGLRAERAPDEDPDRSEYGQRVHRILQRFTEAGAVTERSEAQTRLETLAQDVFAPDLRTHTLAQLWLAEFRSRLPDLLDWLLQRPPSREIRCELKLTGPLGRRTLAGRADRLEIRTDGRHALVDYKTGAVPKEADVLSGEAVQLLHYAALDPAIASVEYLALKDGQKNLLIDEPLAELREQTRQRLGRALAAMEAGRPLPAQGDDETCEHCDYQGLCRRGDWRE